MRTPDLRAYMRLAALLRDQITPGERLPSIGELRQKQPYIVVTCGYRT